MTIFNIDKCVNVNAEVEKGTKAKVAHLWDMEGNCLQERLTIARWINVKAACEYMLRDQSAVSVNTECGVTVYRGKA